jgi:diacylglycerol kinase family enzyme
MQMLVGPLFSDRAAFVLNENARAVNDRVVAELLSVVPAGDLFVSKSLEDAERIADLIARRGYGRVFTGGGDGTLVSTLNLVEAACAARGCAMPEVGVLRLGTGNAVAGMLGAGSPKADAAHIAAGGAASTRDIYMVREGGGAQAPFAGVGYDGEILNDYIAFKTMVQARYPVLLPLVTSVLGYLLAMFFVTVPRYVRGKTVANVRVTSKHDAFKVLTDEDGNDYEVRIPAGEVIYEGRAPVLSVGSVPFFGGGFTNFPHVFRREGHMQMRVAALPIARILLNLFPRVWKGTYRHPELHDFLVKDVQIETDKPLAYQLGGDAEGMRDTLRFSVTEEPIKMVVLEDRAAMNPLGLLKSALGLRPTLPEANASVVRRG